MFSLDYVLGILEEIAASDVKVVKLLDRTFNSDPKRALTIARYMNEHCLKQRFQMEVVAETLSPELLNFFTHEADPKRFRLEIGVQSFCEKTLNSVGRQQNNKRLKEVIWQLQRAHITLHVDLIAGLPYEDKVSFEQSFNSLFAFRCDELQLGILKLLKGTELRKEKERYGFVSQELPPYAIQKTNWLNEQELLALTKSAAAVEKYWNSGRCCYTIRELLDGGYGNSAYALFEALGEEYAKLSHPYAIQQLFQSFVQAIVTHPQVICVDKRLLIAMLNMDYYAQGNQRLPHFHEDKLSEQCRRKLKQSGEAYGISRYDLDHYSAMSYGWYAHRFGYQLVVYQKEARKPQRYWCDEAMQEWKEIKNEITMDCDRECA